MNRATAVTTTAAVAVTKGIRDMKIVSAVEAMEDAVTRTPVTPTKRCLPPLKLTLRKKLSPVLDEVLASVPPTSVVR